MNSVAQWVCGSRCCWVCVCVVVVVCVCVGGRLVCVIVRSVCRSFIFSPDVPIRLDYHGKRVDMEQVGSGQ